jgi:CheY-like chemotaxis protein
VDLKTMIAGMEDMLAQSLRGDIRLELDLADSLWSVEVDPTQLQIALINIAVNARDAMQKGGTFRVKTENTVLRSGKSREAVAISLTDTGTGIPPEVLAQVFEPFFTTKEVGKGTGLGLAQVYGFAQQSGGTVDIRSDVGRGTTVTLYLPKGKSATAHPVQAGSPREPSLQPLRILLVEDNAEVAEVARLLLSERGHTVIHAGTVDDALDILSAGEPVDLTFSDLVMPGGRDGLDLARTIRDRWPNVPILLATGYSDAANRATDEGFTLLLKPYEPETLMSAISHAIGVGPAIRRGNVIPLARSSN